MRGTKISLKTTHLETMSFINIVLAVLVLNSFLLMKSKTSSQQIDSSDTVCIKTSWHSKEGLA
jgi:hypothetical protein